MLAPFSLAEVPQFMEHSEKGRKFSSRKKYLICDHCLHLFNSYTRNSCSIKSITNGWQFTLLWRNAGEAGATTTSPWICERLRRARVVGASPPRSDGCTHRCTCRTGWTWRIYWKGPRRGRRRSRWLCACDEGSSSGRPCTPRSSWACTSEYSCSRRRTSDAALGPCVYASTSFLSVDWEKRVS